MHTFEVILMRGLPGSGKTTHLRDAFKNHLFFHALEKKTLSSAEVTVAISEGNILVVSADDAQDLPIPARHARCFAHYLRILETAIQIPTDVIVVVDNTNLTSAEMAPYIAGFNALVLPAQPNALISIRQIQCDMKTAWVNQTHDVPSGIWLGMQRRFLTEELPPWFPVIDLVFRE